MLLKKKGIYERFNSKTPLPKLTIPFKIMVVGYLLTLSILPEAGSLTPDDRQWLDTATGFPVDTVATELRMDAVELPVIADETENSLFSECHYCQKENRLWYTSIDKVEKIASYCGFDFLEIRIDQMFVRDRLVILTMVYCSVDASGGVVVDSVITIQRNAYSSRKIVAGGRSLEASRTPRSIVLHAASPGSDIGGGGSIRRLAAKAGDFSSNGVFDGRNNRFSYSFVLDGQRYTVDKKGIMMTDTRNVAVETDVSGGIKSRSKTYFRLGKFADTVDCYGENNPEKMAAEVSAMIRDRYFYNQCIVDYDINTPVGVASLRFYASGVIDTAIECAGATKAYGSLPVGFGQKATDLSIRITDTKGASILKQIRIFKKMERDKMKRIARTAMQESRTVWARKNPLYTSINTISRFEGNVISALLDIYCQGQAQEHLLRIPDRINHQCVTTWVIPTEGRAPFRDRHGCDNQAVYRYRLNLGAKHICRDGARIVALEDPSLPRGPNQEKTTMEFEFPLGDGYYMPKWYTKTLESACDSLYTTVLVGSGVNHRKGKLIVSDIPFILDAPSHGLEFALIINHPLRQDSLLITYTMTCLDRSGFVWSRMIDCGKAVKQTGTVREGTDAVLCYTTEHIERGDAEKIVCSHEKIESTAKILSLYVFVYSTKMHKTVGVGGLWSGF